MGRFSLLRRAGYAGVVVAVMAAGPLGAGPVLAAEVEPEGTVSGTVTDGQTGEPLADICVDVAARDFSGASGSACTDASGDYTTSPLPPGDYVVRFLDQSGAGYLGEHYDNQSERALAETVAVGEGADTAGIDAALTLGGRITGTISSDSGPSADQCVYAYPAGTDHWVRSGCTDASGVYTINRLPAGTYDLRIDGGADYLAVWYGGTADRATATPVQVELGQTTTGVDQVMADGGRLSGTVRDAETGEPLVYEDFCVHVLSGASEIRTVCPWATGDWQVLGLPGGTYTVKFTADGYATQWWDGQTRQSRATPLVLDGGEDRTGVDASLARPVESAPDAPTSVAATAGNAQAQVSWTEPESDGGQPVTGYTVTASPGGQTATTTGSTSAAVTGLSNGTAYTFTVTATNAIGTSAVSAPSNEVTPMTAPSAPTGVTAFGGNAQAQVSWSAPGDTGGSPITGYAVTASPGGQTVSTTGATSATISGLSNGTAYTFTVTATNAVGDSPASAPSNAVTPATTPGEPTAVSATAGDAEAQVSWAAPESDGGAVISGYTVTASPGGQTAMTDGGTTATVTGLANGTAYIFTVTATNRVGSSAASSPSSEVTPATTPGAPTAVTATRGDGEAQVSWTAPQSDGGAAITGYTVTASPGGQTATTDGGTTATVTGLSNGTAYAFTVTATNRVGTSGPSAPSATVAPATTPGPPTGVTAFRGSAQAQVSWTAPESDGGAAISGYTVTASPGGQTATTDGGSTATVTGLDNGTAYTFTVRATNAVGDSSASAPSNEVTPATTPSAPAEVSATAGDARAQVSWTAPTSDGGSPVTGYTVTASPGGKTVVTDGAAGSATVTGLVNGTAYTFTVTATNAVGDSPASQASSEVIPATTPGAPTAVTATRGDSQAQVGWGAPESDGGAAITGYTVTASPGGRTATTDGGTTATVTGLSNGTAYTFTVTATNAAGDSQASTPSNEVTPATTPGAPTAVTAARGDTEAQVSWTAPASDGGAPVTGYTVTASPGGATTSTTGATTATVTGLANGTAYTFTVTATNAVGTSQASTPSSAVTPEPLGVVARWAGSDRYASSADFSAKSFDPGVAVAYVATGENFPDALSAAPIAGITKSPVLLTRRTFLPAAISQELARLKPRRIVVLGSEGVVSERVSEALRTFTTGSVERWYGSDRYASSADFSRRSFATGVDVAYLATGENFPDALSAAPVAGVTGGPILLTRPGQVPAPIAAELNRLRPRKIVVLGSEGVVSAEVQARLKAYTTGTVERWSGADRFASASDFSSNAFVPGVDVAYIATGHDFPDALSAAPIAGMTRGPVLLTNPTSLPPATSAELTRLRPTKIVVLGSDGVVSTNVETQLKNYLS